MTPSPSLAAVVASSITVAGVVAATLAGCRPDPMPTTTPPSAMAPSGPPAPSPLGEIVAALVPMAPGGDAIVVEDVGAAIDACKAAGWPELLPSTLAAALPSTATGSHATVVHPLGTTTVTIESIGCQPPDDIAGPQAWLYLVTPPPIDPRAPEVRPELRGLVGRRHLAVLGATVASTAQLREPPRLDGRAPAAEAVRSQLVAHAEHIAADRRGRCTDAAPELVPTAAASTAAIPAAVDDAVVHPVRHGEATLIFAILSDDAVTFDCHGGADQVAVLLDHDGEVLFEHSSNNGIELQWVMDLDGDGVEEGLLDTQYLEDGGHEIALLHGDDGVWDAAVLWSVDAP